MYSIFKIYQSDKLVLVTYHDIIPEFTDNTKLKLIFNSPTIPLALFEDYFKSPELFSIETFKIGIYNALDASQIVIAQSKLIGIDKPKTNKITSNNRANKLSKPRTKKAEKPVTEPK